MRKLNPYKERIAELELKVSRLESIIEGNLMGYGNPLGLPRSVRT